MTQYQSINRFGNSIISDEVINALDEEQDDEEYGAIDFNGKVVSDVGTPVLPNDAATKEYVDNSDNLRLIRSAGPAQEITGDLYMGMHKIKNVFTPADAEDNDVVNINYFKARTADYLTKYGFQMDGGPDHNIYLNGNNLNIDIDNYITADLSTERPSFKIYFRNFLNFYTYTGNIITLSESYIDFHNYFIKGVRAPTEDDQPVNRGYLDATYCKNTGFSMVGRITMGGNELKFSTAGITQINETLYISGEQITLSQGNASVANISPTGLTLTNNINMGNNRILLNGSTIKNDNDTGTLVIDSPNIALRCNDANILRIAPTVITLDKNLNANFKIIYNLSTPTRRDYAANKGYVDDKFKTPFRYTTFRSDSNNFTTWSSFIPIEQNISVANFDLLPTGLFACFSSYIPFGRKGNLPNDTKGYLTVIVYQETPINKYFRWVNAVNGEEWTARIYEGGWNNWIKQNSLLLNELDQVQNSLDMNNFGIINLASPIVSSDATNRGYVDSAISTASNNKVNKSGDTMTGNLLMGGYFITGMHDPITSADATNKGYVDTAISTASNTKVSKSGDTMTGNLNMNGNNIIGLPVTSAGINGNSSALSYGLFIASLVDFSNTVVQKVGDTMSGDLLLTVGTNTNRTFGCIDLTGTKVFNVLLGSSSDQIQAQVDQPVNFLTGNGLLVKDNNVDVIRFGTSSTDYRTNIYQDILMNQKYIANLHDPTSNQDAATKRYVDIRLIRNTVPFIPYLAGFTNNKGNIIITQSSSAGGQYNAWRIWKDSTNTTSNSGGEWAAATATNQTVTIQFPHAIRTWKTDLVGRNGTTMYFNNWRLEASNNGTTFTTLFTSTDLLDSTYKSFIYDSLIEYSYYRFNGINSTGGANPGLCFWQLYTLDVLQ